MEKLQPPQLVVNSRMLYFGWVPADPKAAEELVPTGLRPLPNRQVFINQYQVDSDEQTSHFGAYSLTYLGLDVADLDIPGGVPARWWTHYINSSEQMNEFAKRVYGVPTSSGTTELELIGKKLVATTYQDERPVIRTTVETGPAGDLFVRAHLRYITKVGGEFVSGRYPAIGHCADPFKVTKLEFLDPSHSLYALRPKEPLEVTWGFYFHNAAFAYPGGLEPLTSEEIRRAQGR